MKKILICLILFSASSKFNMLHAINTYVSNVEELEYTIKRADDYLFVNNFDMALFYYSLALAQAESETISKNDASRLKKEASIGKLVAFLIKHKNNKSYIDFHNSYDSLRRNIIEFN